MQSVLRAGKPRGRAQLVAGCVGSRASCISYKALTLDSSAVTWVLVEDAWASVSTYMRWVSPGLLTGLRRVPSVSAIHSGLDNSFTQDCLQGLEVLVAQILNKGRPREQAEWRNKLSWASSLRSKNHGVLGTHQVLSALLSSICM